MRKLPARKLLGTIIAGVLLLPTTAFTLGLGEIEVNSALNQKLKADIELLSATPEDIENIIVKLASRKEFSRAGLDRPYLLNDLNFKSEVVDGAPRIIVSSGSPIREPFLNFLVEIDWPNGHLIREYTVLLDPPVFMTQPASAASAPANKNASTNNSNFRPDSGASTNVVPVLTPGVSSSPAAQASGTVAAPQTTAPVTNPTFIPAPYVQPQAAVNQPSDSYRIKQGDTAWSLANAMRPDQSISVEQMMIAMLRANPESFINENINGLKRGYILRVPDYNQIVSINPADARALVREQAALWRQYQQTHAASKPTSAMSSDATAGSSAGDDTHTSAEDDAYLEIVSAGSGSSTASSKDPTDMTSQELRAELALARERVETERVEKEALQNRVDSLEQNVDKMKGMLSIEDNELSGVQALAETAEVEPTEGEMLEADIVADAEAEMAESSAETDDMLSEQNLDDAVSEAATDDSVVDEADTENTVFLDEAESTEAAVDMPTETDSMQNEATADAEESQTPLITRPAEKGVLDKLLSDPILLAAAGGGLLFIIAMMALIIKRRKASADTEAESFELDAVDDNFDALDEAVAASEVGADESESANANQADEETDFDSDSTMILDSAEDTIIAEEDSAMSSEEEEPRDDVIAEADVYLAYGIYQQAEELLTQAITDNPERDDYRVKLAETHYASKNSDAFVAVATELRKRTEDDMNPMWKKVMVMGQDLCADNALFQGSMVGGLDVDSLSPKTPEMDFDLGMDNDSGDASPDLDLSLDEEPLELPEIDNAIEETAEEISEEAASEIEFDLSDAGAVEEAVVEEDEFSLDIDATELDIDIQDDASPATNVDDEIHDAGDVDLDFGLDDEPAADDKSDSESDEEVAFDLTSDAEALGLDLDDDSATDDVTPTPAPLSAEDEEDFDLSSLDDVDEVSTKLDLARAYLDMGDHEGTRGILEEVIAEGNDEQKEEANELMSKLD